MASIYGALLSDLGSLAQSQYEACQYQRALAHQRGDTGLYNAYAFNAATIPGLKNIGNRKFVPITQEEVDMAEAWYEVDKIAPGLKKMS